MPTHPVPSYLTRTPVPALGMTSLVLGVIGLILALVPVLGAPMSACGIIFGIVGVFAAFTVPGSYFRAAVAGLATSVLALVVNLAIAYAPGRSREVPPPRTPTPWQRVPDNPVTPPPGRPA